MKLIILDISSNGIGIRSGMRTIIVLSIVVVIPMTCLSYLSYMHQWDGYIIEHRVCENKFKVEHENAERFACNVAAQHPHMRVQFSLDVLHSRAGTVGCAETPGTLKLWVCRR